MELKDIKDSSVKIETGNHGDSQKKVGFWFGLGIFIAPYIFGWFTLKKGYSNTARFVSLFWMLIVVIANVNKSSQNSTPSSANSFTSSESNNASRSYSSLPKWRVGRYVDEFKKSTKEKYLTTDEKITGTFSNTATTNSPLVVDILVEKKSVGIRLYEYAGNTPATFYSSYDVKIKVLDSKGKKHNFQPSSEFKGIVLTGNSAKKLMNILKEGGEISFYIENDSNGIVSSYNFSLNNVTEFEESYKKL